jgi:dephospho-CoA kinase
MRLTKVGLTGGIATGKSSVAELWRARGARIIDSDALAHQTLTPGTPTYAAVVAAFGGAIVRPDGTINRPALGEIVFADASRRQVLNGIVHPAVRQMWSAALAGAQGQVAVAVVTIPLLFEIGAEKEFDVVVVTGCSEATQLARLAGKGMSAAAAQARIRAQLPTQWKLDRGDFVIWNDGTPAVLARQADLVWKNFKEEA